MNERDPLADLVSRSVGARVESVTSEELASADGLERKRLRFATTSGAASAIFIRSPRGVTLEAQLLPFLARKTDRVPVVHSRGLPPPHAALGPWLLIEDVLAGASACEADAVDVIRAKFEVERAIASDQPALRALGLGSGPIAESAVPRSVAEATERLERLPRTLVHGNLTCANAFRVSRGVVLVDWQDAHIGPSVWDVARLATDLRESQRADDAHRVEAAYLERSPDGDLDLGAVAIIADFRRESWRSCE